ncbi:MAG: tRNA (guanosine(46)-N7)-methyltransferase TrmB [Phycisphaera sp.]|nr:tRNA (guanosine(46)-N7)-methyltransferase TrmB [Phycisphaera sp.]
MLWANITLYRSGGVGGDRTGTGHYPLLAMSFSLSRKQGFDTTGVGYETADLPVLLPGQSRVDPTVFDPRDWFGPDRRGLPFELEIGSGKGTFLVQQSVLQPGVNFLGIEYARAFCRYAADRVRRNAIANVKLLHAEAGFFVQCYIPDGIVERVHIYFPDPWPKARHHKRRLVQEPFLRMVHSRLVSRGCIRLATDHTDYFEWMCDHASRVSDLFVVEPFENTASAGEGELVGSNFERKYRREGRPFHAMVLRKIG